MDKYLKIKKQKLQISKIIIFISVFLIPVGLLSQESDRFTLYNTQGYNFPYNINNPDKTWELPNRLVEISGLSYIDQYRLACIQDEKGNLYIFNLLTGYVERKIDFEEDGDYEGVEIIEHDAWILKSNGTLYKIKNYLNDNSNDIEKYPTILTRKNDAEGLAYDPVSKHLLIGCKGHPFTDDRKGKDFKALYRFNIETNLLDLDPYLLVDLDFIKNLKNYNTLTKLGVELLAYLDNAKGDLTFQPSAVSIHPLTKEIYVLASVGNMLTIYSPEKKVQTIIQLNTKIHPQPEGICFSPDGTLYISNEGKDGDGTITKFTIKTQPQQSE